MPTLVVGMQALSVTRAPIVFHLRAALHQLTVANRVLTAWRSSVGSMRRAELRECGRPVCYYVLCAMYVALCSTMRPTRDAT